MAKKATRMKTSRDGGPARAPVVLITNGYRVRPKEIDAKSIAVLGDKEWKTQEQFQKLWEAAIGRVKEDAYVLGGTPKGVTHDAEEASGEGVGIFSRAFTDQVAQVTDLDNVWCPSIGLGMVCLGAKYPQYDLGEFDSNIKLAPTENGHINERAWWHFVTQLSGNSITSIVVEAVKKGSRVVIALPGLQLTPFKDDLKALVAHYEKKGVEALESACAHIRFVGPDLERTVPTKLLPCVMPFDREALDVWVPGMGAHATRRMAKLLIERVPCGEDGASPPLTDFKAMTALFETSPDESEIITFQAGNKYAGGKYTKLDDVGLAEHVHRCAQVVGDIPARIVRMLREDGYQASQEAVEVALAGGKPKKSKKSHQAEAA